MSDHELANIRDAIAQADADLVKALDARARAVKSYVKLREAQPDVYYALPSAADVVRKAIELATDFPHEPLETALREVLGACAEMIAPVRVALVGPEAGFAHLAASRHFGSSAAIQTLKSVSEVFEEVERKRVSYGVVPFETSTDGALSETLHALVAGEARISSEVTVACTYDLVSETGNVADVDKIYGTPEALKACAQTLHREHPKAMLLDVASGRVALELAREDHGAAALAVGGSQDVEKGLRRVRERVEDRTGVETRYVIIGHERAAKTGHDQTLLALGVGDEPGSLHTALRPFAERDINLTRIESRPARGAAWRYLFIIELEGHVTDRGVLTAIDEVRSVTRHLKVLGSYPRP